MSYCIHFIIIKIHHLVKNNLSSTRTNGGVRKASQTITSPTVMWVKALDLLMNKLKVTGLDFCDIAALSGAGQVNIAEIIKL